MYVRFGNLFHDIRTLKRYKADSGTEERFSAAVVVVGQKCMQDIYLFGLFVTIRSRRSSCALYIFQLPLMGNKRIIPSAPSYFGQGNSEQRVTFDASMPQGHFAIAQD